MTGNAKSFGYSQRCRHSTAQSFTLDQLSNYEVSRVCLSDFIDGDDTRMVKCRGGSGLLLKASYAFLVGGVMRWQYLERDSATQTRIFGEINFAHSAGANSRNDLVRTKGPPRQRFFLLPQRVGH